MAGDTKVTLQNEPQGAPMSPPDRPLLDLSDAAIKKLIHAAQKRGYVTHDCSFLTAVGYPRAGRAGSGLQHRCYCQRVNGGSVYVIPDISGLTHGVMTSRLKQELCNRSGKSNLVYDANRRLYSGISSWRDDFITPYTRVV